jgi:hypothetical protein
MFGLEIPLLQCLRDYRRDLSFVVIIEEEPYLFVGATSQVFLTVSRNPGRSGQKFSNLKICDFGIDVPTTTLQGT